MLEDSSGSVLEEPQTVRPSPDEDTSKLLQESTGANPNATAEPMDSG